MSLAHLRVRAPRGVGVRRTCCAVRAGEHTKSKRAPLMDYRAGVVLPSATATLVACGILGQSGPPLGGLPKSLTLALAHCFRQPGASSLPTGQRANGPNRQTAKGQHGGSA